MAEELLGAGVHGGGKRLTAGQPLHSSYFFAHQGLLYQHTEWHGQALDPLVVPCSKVDLVLHLAYSHPLGGHLASQPEHPGENLRLARDEH